MESRRYFFFSDFKNDLAGQIFEKYSNIKFHEHLRSVLWARTDRQTWQN